MYQCEAQRTADVHKGWAMGALLTGYTSAV